MLNLGLNECVGISTHTQSLFFFYCESSKSGLKKSLMLGSLLYDEWSSAKKSSQYVTMIISS